MQVRKFEARTMKEALQMIKSELGPEAVVLSVREVKSRFSLSGKASVQMTAAISEVTLRGKQFVEERMTSKDRMEFQNSSAQSQREYIHQVVHNTKGAAPSSVMTTPYIEISEEEQGSSSQRIQEAAAKARVASVFLEEKRPVAMVQKEEARGSLNIDSLHRLEGLQEEMVRLRSAVSSLGDVPSNFLSLHPGAEMGVSYESSHVFNKVVQAGVSNENAAEIVRLAQEALSSQQVKNKHLVEAWVVKHLLDSIVCVSNRFEGRYHIFVGPDGHGKTSTLVKFVSEMVMKGHRSIGIVAADNSKVGRVEQLQTYAKILNVDCAYVEKVEDWASVSEKFSHLDSIVVDCPGLSQGGADISSLTEKLPPDTEGRRIHYVQSILSRENEVASALCQFSPLGLSDIIFTRLDESNQHGLIFNLQKKYGLPLHSFGIGPQIPEDFEPATRERVVDLIFKLTKSIQKGARGECEL